MKNVWKKVLAVTMMTVLVLSACAGKESGSSVEPVQVRIGSLKGPTTMGLLRMMALSDAEEIMEGVQYTFTMATDASEILAGVAGGDYDIALVPANLASTIYQKTEGGITVLDINTLGVLYMVSGDDTISSVEDLKGHTIYTTGKGQTPEYVLHYILEQNGMKEGDVTIEYKSEATEVAAVLAQDPTAVGMLPQPFVTVALAQNESLKIVLDMTEEWEKIGGENGSSLVTGVTIVRDTFLEEHPVAVALFMEEHKKSAEFAVSDVTTTASYVAERGIIEKAPVAEKALPYCNIVYIDGDPMKQALSSYLEVLFEQDPSSVGGALPGDDFYYSR